LAQLPLTVLTLFSIVVLIGCRCARVWLAMGRERRQDLAGRVAEVPADPSGGPLATRALWPPRPGGEP